MGRILVGTERMGWCQKDVEKGSEVRHGQESVRHIQGVVNDLIGYTPRRKKFERELKYIKCIFCVLKLSQ